MKQGLACFSFLTTWGRSFICLVPFLARAKRCVPTLQLSECLPYPALFWLQGLAFPTTDVERLLTATVTVQCSQIGNAVVWSCPCQTLVNLLYLENNHNVSS